MLLIWTAASVYNYYLPNFWQLTYITRPFAERHTHEVYILKRLGMYVSSCAIVLG